MITRDTDSLEPDGSGKEKKASVHHIGAGHDADCRCKETAKMTPQELIKLMIRDLTFWKKEKKN